MEETSLTKGERKIVGFTLQPRVKKILVAILAVLLLIGVGFAINLVAKTKGVSTLKKAKTSLKIGTNLYKKGKFNKAISSLEKTVELDPSNTKAHLLLARSYEATGEIDKAETEYKKYIDLDASNPEVHYNLAIIYKSQGKTKEAVSELEKAIKLRKEFVAARLILAELYAQQGQKQKAIEQYQAVIDMKPFGIDMAEIEKKLDNLK